MSIAHCKICALSADTDFDNETLNAYELCEPCTVILLGKFIEANESLIDAYLGPLKSVVERLLVIRNLLDTVRR